MLADLAPVEAAGLSVFDLDTYALIDQAVSDPSKFGFSDVKDPAGPAADTGYATGGTLCSTLPAVQDTYLFWDEVHPTAAGHLLVAEDGVLPARRAVPEPSTWAMMILGFAGLGVLGARKKALGRAGRLSPEPKSPRVPRATLGASALMPAGQRHEGDDLAAEDVRPRDIDDVVGADRLDDFQYMLRARRPDGNDHDSAGLQLLQ